MTNKPMLSVERELLESISSGAYCKPDVMAKLRALLDKPVCSICRDLGDVCMECEAAAQHQGEPVYMVRDHGSCCWEEMSGESLELCQAQPEEYEVRKLYAEQPAPVAILLPERMVKTDRSSDEYDMCADAHNDCLDAVAILNGVNQ